MSDKPILGLQRVAAGRGSKPMRREVTFRNAPSAVAPINSVWSENERKPEISGPTYPTSAGLYSNSDLRPTFTRQIFRAFRYQILCALRVFSSANFFPGRAKEHHVTDWLLRNSDRHFFIERFDINSLEPRTNPSRIL